LEFVDQQGARFTLGMLQELVANQGDGWNWSLEELRLYYEAHAVGASAARHHRGRQSARILLLSEERLPESVTASMGLYYSKQWPRSAGARLRCTLVLAVQSEDPAFRPQPLDKSESQPFGPSVPRAGERRTRRV